MTADSESREVPGQTIRNSEELGDFKDLGDFCRTLLMMSGRARAMNRVINLIVDYVDHQLELFFSLSLFQTLN